MSSEVETVAIVALLYMVDEGELVAASARLATCGFQVVPVGSLDEARRALAEHEVACAFVEVRSTHPAGLAIMGQLRGARASAPVVVLSSDLDLSSRIAGRDAGAEHYLSTPVRGIDLDMRVAELRVRLARAGDRVGASESALEALPLPEPDATTAGDEVLPLPEPDTHLALENEELRATVASLQAQLAESDRRADEVEVRLAEEDEATHADVSPRDLAIAAARSAPTIGGRPPPEVDVLTGLIGAGALQDHLDREYARARRYGHALSVLMLDVDRLRRYDKSYGNAAGDRALCLVADVLRAALRSPDIAARVGGDEFVIIATDTTEEQALKLAERLRGALREEGQHAAQPPVTVSIGIASCNRSEVKCAEDLLKAARTAVMRAKAAGRDRAAAAI